MRPLTIGIVGFGRIVRRVHLASLARMPEVTVVAVADPDPGARAAARERFPRVPTFEDAEALLDDARVDAVLVCLPSHLHADAAEAAFAAGKHVYLEKPLATEAAGAARVARAWRAAGRVGMVGLNYRHDPRYRKLRSAVAALGGVTGVRTVFCSASPPPAWKRSRATGGGALLDLASHHADLVRFVTGEEVDEVSASIRSIESEGDTASVRMRLAGGATVDSFFSLCAADDDRFEVVGRRARVVVDRLRSPGLEHFAGTPGYGRFAQLGRELRGAWRGFGRVARAGGEPSFAAALRAFVRAARGDGAVEPDVGEGLRALEIVLAAESAARTGRATRVERA